MSSTGTPAGRRPVRTPTPRRPHHVAALVTAAALTLAVAACGSTGSTTTAGGGAGSAPASGNVAVTIKDFAFTPQTVTVRVGATVTWTNDDSTPHTVEFRDRAIPTSPQLSAGGGQQSWSHTFEAAGTYPYICSIHTYMTGTVKVVG